MYLVVGLGNPGEEYDDTPHNAGFRFVDSVRTFLGYDSLFDVSDWQYDKYTNANLSVCKVNQTVKIVLAKPHTFMNKSGVTVRSLLSKYEIEESRSLVLIHDDLDIVLGKYKIQRTRAPHGHKGVESVHNFVEDKDFLRVRVGVDNRNGSSIPGEVYVLNKYNKEELISLDETIADAIKNLRGMLAV